MICPQCSSEKIEVIETRRSQKIAIRRARRCAACRTTWTTYEVEAGSPGGARANLKQLVREEVRRRVLAVLGPVLEQRTYEDMLRTARKALQDLH